jgi:hypothetical protein
MVVQLGGKAHPPRAVIFLHDHAARAEVRGVPHFGGCEHRRHGRACLFKAGQRLVE